jgi:hypothetical protein
MRNLLRIHFYFSKKTLLLLLLIFIVLLVLHTSSIIYLDSITPSIYFFMIFPFIGISHILNEKFSYHFRLFPISTKDFVQSTFLYVTILFLVILIPIFTLICYQYIQGEAKFFKTSLMFGLISYSLIATGGMIASYFKEPTKYDQSKPNGDLIFYFLFVLIAQTFISALFHVLQLDMIGVLITPMICVFIFYKDYQRSIRHYETAEFL